MLSYRPCNSTMEPFCLEKLIHGLGCRVSSFSKITDECFYSTSKSILLSLDLFIWHGRGSPVVFCAYLYMNILHVLCILHILHIEKWKMSLK